MFRPWLPLPKVRLAMQKRRSSSPSRPFIPLRKSRLCAGPASVRIVRGAEIRRNPRPLRREHRPQFTVPRARRRNATASLIEFLEARSSLAEGDCQLLRGGGIKLSAVELRAAGGIPLSAAEVHLDHLADPS